MKRVTEDQFAARIGIDWADTKHDVCLRARGSERLERSVLEHRVESIDRWARDLRERFAGEPIAVCVEISKGPLVYALQKYDFFVLFPVNPATLAKYREAFTPSHAKDDPTDAELALELLNRHRERLTALHPESADMRALQQLVESRRRLVDDTTRITNRLTSAVKNYYPQVLDWFDNKATYIFCDFLSQWPTPEQAQRTRRTTLQRFFCNHHVRRHDNIERRIAAIKSARPLTTDPGVIEPNRVLVNALIAQLRVTLQAVAQFDREILERHQRLSDHRIFDSFPAAGPTLSPRLLAACGEQRQRYSSASQLARYTGIAPVTERSGKSSWVHWRTRCPTFLRQSFVEWAAQTIPRSFWANAYYRHQRDKGCSHQAAVRALAFKWIRIVYRCWRDRVEYDEARYLRALQQRGSPLLSYVADVA